MASIIKKILEATQAHGRISAKWVWVGANASTHTHFANWMISSPPRLWLNLTNRVDLSDPVATGQQLVLEYDCRSCHQIAGLGWPFGPILDSVAIKLDHQTLDSFCAIQSL